MARTEQYLSSSGSTTKYMIWIHYFPHSSVMRWSAGLQDLWGFLALKLSFSVDALGPFQFSSVAQSCPTLCDPRDCSTPGFPVLHHILEFAQTHVHWLGEAIQPSHPLPPSSPPALNLSQLTLFQWVSSLHQVAKVLELQLQSFQ